MSSMKNTTSLKTKLYSGKTVIGTWCALPSPEFINVLAKAGMDFVIIDMEHGAMDYELAGKMVIAAEVEGCSPLIRVPMNNESTILRALEVAPEGIIVPHVDSAKERKNVINAVKFPPIGNRSLNPFVRAGGYHSRLNFTEEENKRTLSGILVESLAAIKNIESIVDDENLDIVYMGSYDISAALGCPGDTRNPKVLATLRKLAKVITKKKKIAGCLFHTKEDLEFFKEIGATFLCYKVDTGIVFDAVQKGLKLL